jgi:hypothetical protein
MTHSTVTPEMASAIRKLAEQSKRSETDPDLREAAVRTGGLPVYADLGGILLLTPEARVLRYDPEMASVAEVTEERWKALALARAARKFPGLESLRPQAVNAVTCQECHGEGVILGDVDCGTCFGLGWLADSEPRSG